MLVFLLWASLFLSSLQEQNGQDGYTYVAPGVQLSGPQNVSVDYDLKDQRISVTWEDDPSSSRVPDKLIYDVEVLLTVNMTEVHSEAVDVRPTLASRKYHWSWTSALPLECTSRSVRLRSRYQNYTSQWSPLQTITGSASSHPQVFPRSSVVQVDSNFTFCCILGPGQRLEYMKYNNILMNTTHIIDQSYAMVVHMQSPSPPSCINVYCNSPLYGTCVYVGYPPGDRNLVCETRDLESVECHWDTGRATNLTKQRMTRYHLNGRACPNRTVSNCYQTVRVDQGERNWTLTARNPLGTLELRDTADLKKRVRLLAPMEVVASGVNASVQWQWERPQYHILLMVCQVQLNHSGHIDMRNYSGIGLRSVVLHGLAPAQTYTVQVCCGLKQHFWKWGDWSEGSTFKTEEDIPEALDVWMQIEGNQTIILWKPLTVNQSHGQIKDYEVTWGRQETIVHPPQNDLLISDRSTDEGHRVTVTAKNSAGSSLPSIIIIPRLPHRSKSSMKIVGSDGGFNLSWSASPNASCGYVVDWCPTHTKCRVEWVKVPAGITRARIQSASFEEGVRYTLSIFACTPGAPELWERREGYVKECLPKGQIQKLAAEQHGSDTVLISWTGIPPENQTAFIHGYIIYYFDTSHPSSMRIFNVTTDEPGAKNLTGIPVSSYRFIVKALTSVGEGGDSSPVFLQMNPQTDQLIPVIIISLGSAACLLTLVTILCYRNWKCVKENLYPEIPKPVWKEEWLTPLGNGRQILYVDPCQPSEIDIVCNREQSGEAVLDNNAGKGALTNTNSDVPALHGYYNQLLSKTTSGHFTFSPHTMGSPSSQLSGTVIQNPSYNLEVQASLDMEQSVGYEPDMNSFSCPNPEPHNAMSYVPVETDSWGYKFQYHIEDSSPLQE
ncbi:leukemia inhibitory factor receptor isoform X2 [Salvelinus sp. IW2-2015]|uniref:leukemia inhibitory factor receptor isoform X2 n=1 Tax=Salvelinus sp. IW2-2015 TaxID=2691554 RepID=UPI000CDF7E9F|nr:leukemia inhibitory factor receptor isoform X2 [Salvelinus alpinus]